MANPFFNATYYNQQNKDVYVSGMDAYTHYVQFGASEALEGAATRKPAPWFDIEFYYENNPDLIAAKLTPAQLFDHFANYGYKEGRAPNAIAQENVNADSLLAYALANADLREAFGIDAEATELTTAQYVDLAGHYYQFGYNEARPGLPSTESGGEVVGEYDYLLTVGHDTIEVEGSNKTIFAGLEQNFLGAVTNTLESGDVIKGEKGAVGNKLVVDLALSVTGTETLAPAISAYTENIDRVELRAQTGNTDDVDAAQGNGSHIDAENFKEVKEWFSVNSRATIQIEDVRTRPEDTTIGLQNSDPKVGFKVYFDPQKLKNDLVYQDSALTIKLADLNKPDSLEDVPVDGVSFKLGGQSYTVQSEEMGAATTHEEFVAALKAELGKNEALAGLVVELNADNTITLVDPNGVAFEKGGWKFINDEVPADGNIAYEQTVGAADESETLITTNVVLDNVGRTSRGGDVDIGSLGDGGVQQFDVQVGDSSWVSSLQSNSYLGRGPDTKAFLEVVNVAHLDGKTGNLTIGNPDGRWVDDPQSPNGKKFVKHSSVDGRVYQGLTDVRELNAKDFTGDIKVGIDLTNDVARRYLDNAEDTVNFIYTTGSGNDNVTLDIDSGIASDDDFALSVDLGAGDDRLNLWLNGADANKVSVNGGEGYNTIEVNSSHGVDATNEFANFENFQQYVVAGDNDTTQNFASMAGVERVVVATEAETPNGDLVDTKLLNLEEGAAVSISGKNQTLDADNNNTQLFGDVTVNGAAGAALTVSLDNAARLDGLLLVEGLNVDADRSTSTRANTTVRTLDLESNGQRDVFNAVGEIDARFVDTFNITGTQSLYANIENAANHLGSASARGNFVVNANELDADLILGINSEIINRIDAAADRTNTLIGAEGDGDVLFFDGTELTVSQATTIKGFESVNFLLDDDVQFDATNVSGVEEYNLISGDAFSLTKLSDGIDVNVVTAGVDGNVSLMGAGSAINVSLVSTEDIDNTHVWGDASTELQVVGYTTIDLDLANVLGYLGADANKEGTEAQHYEFTLNTADNTSNVSVAKELVLTGGRKATKNALVDLADPAASSDSVTLNDLNTSIETVNLTGYAGKVTGSFDDDVANAASFIADVTVTVGAWDMDWTVTEVVGTPQQVYNTTFVFTDSFAKGTGKAAVWKINDFNAVGDVAVTADNKTVLDVSGLGIAEFTQLSIGTNVAGNAVITADIPASDKTWTIEIAGAVVGDITADNFIFA